MSHGTSGASSLDARSKRLPGMNQAAKDFEKEEREVVDWFRSEVLPKILRDGRLPVCANSTIESCKFTITERWTDHFASSPYFLDLVVKSGGAESSLNLFVKFFLQDDDARDVMHPQRLFRNETKMYSEVLPCFRRALQKNPRAPANLVDDLCPECFYAHFDEDNHKRSVLVFANLKALRFGAAESRIFLDFEHCATALRQLARFHAMSLALKVSSPGVLEKVKDVFVEARYFDDPAVRKHCDVFHGKCNQRAIDYLLSLEKPVVPREYLLNFRKILRRPFELMTRLLQPEEPLAVICHGDFCRNNLFFRHEGGRVACAKMFDFQASRYSSPSIDLSFFLYFNTTQELRDSHWDELLSLYYDALVSTVSRIADLPEEDVSDRFPFRMLAEDFARRAIYGYFHVAFFQAMMTGAAELTWQQTPEEQAEILYSAGGEEVSKRVADVIADFYKRKFYLP